MKRDNPAKHFILAFAIALAGYVLVYRVIENQRTRKGPWLVTFTNSLSGTPEIVINQAALNISNVQIEFANALLMTNQFLITNDHQPITLRFNQPKPVPYDVAFGKCVFMDTTFQPGTLTFQFFDHEIELLPRVLVIDRKEHAWKSGEVIALTTPADTNASPNSVPKR